MPNGIKLLTGIVNLAEKSPITAVILALIILAIFTGGGSFIGSFWGQDSKISSAIAELQNKNVYLESFINAVDKARIEEHVRLKEDGKLLSEASIRLIIKQELQDFADRFILRLNSN